VSIEDLLKLPEAERIRYIESLPYLDRLALVNASKKHIENLRSCIIENGLVEMEGRLSGDIASREQVEHLIKRMSEGT
jgi:hypothetical protein